jgi:hypothetical protein
MIPEAPGLLTLERQIAILAECGILLPDGLSIETLVNECGLEAFEDDPFRSLIIDIGRDDLEVPSEHFWHFDTECIYDHGDYVRIAERMRTLARGALPITNLQDHLDLDEEVAWLSFDLDGRRVRWDLQVQNDWVDSNVFTQFVKLLDRRRTGRHFTCLDLGGQDCVIGCATDEELARLNTITGLSFARLSR